MNRAIAWLAAVMVLTPPHHSDDASAFAKNARSAGRLLSCPRLVSDTAPRVEAPLRMPGYLESVVDPAFGTTIVRVTGAPGDTIPNRGGRGGAWRETGGPTYAKFPSWNADQSLLVSTTSAAGFLFMDGNDYHVAAFRPYLAGGAEVRWHPTNKDLMVYAFDDGRAGYWNPMADTMSQRIGAATGMHRCRIGPWEGNVSNDGRRIVLACLADGVSGDSAYAFFAVDLGTGTRYPTLRAVDLGFSGATTSNQEPLDWASISPLGDYIVASQDWRQNRALTLDGTVISNWAEMGHYDLGTDANGAQVAFNGSGYLVTLSTGAATQIVRTRAQTYHSSTRSQFGAPGWGIASLEDSAGIMRGEIVAMQLKAGGDVRRLAHHRATSRVNDRNPFGSPSPDGMRVFYRSDWGNASGPVYGFVVDTRALCRGERSLSSRR